MTNSISNTKIQTGRRAYHSPKLTKRGSVQQLTLKMGSFSDGMGPHE